MLLPEIVLSGQRGYVPLFDKSLFEGKVCALAPTVSKLTFLKTCDLLHGSGQRNVRATKQIKAPIKNRNNRIQNRYVQRDNRVAMNNNNSRNTNKDSNYRYATMRYRARIALNEFAVEPKPNWSMVRELPIQSFANCVIPHSSVKMEHLEWRGCAYKYRDELDLTNIDRPRVLDHHYDADTNICLPDARNDDVLTDHLQKDADIIITGQVLGIIMSLPLSRFGFQISCYKVDDKLIFEKSEGDKTADLTLLYETANQNADIPQIELAAKATKVNYDLQKFSIHTNYPIAKDKPVNFSDFNPICNNYLYRYRMINLPPGRSIPGMKNDDIRRKNLKIATCAAIHAASINEDGELKDYINIHAFNEGLLPNQNIDWKKSLVNKEGHTCMNEIRENANIASRWIINSVLATATQLKIGFVSHKEGQAQLLRFHTVRTKDLISQCGIRLESGWGLFRELCDILLSDKNNDQCQYIIVRDAFAPVVRIYAKSLDDILSDDEQSSYDSNDINFNKNVDAEESD